MKRITGKVMDALTALAKKHGGALTPAIVLDAARPKNSPLHRYIEWDITKAAIAHQLDQARFLIQRVKVTYTTEKDQTITCRAFVNVIDKPGKTDNHPGPQPGKYIPIERAMSNKYYKRQVLAQAQHDVDALLHKLETLVDVSKLREFREELTTQYELANK